MESLEDGKGVIFALLFFLLGDRVSHSPGCPVTHHVAHGGFELLISLPLSPECWLYGGTLEL